MSTATASPVANARPTTTITPRQGWAAVFAVGIPMHPWPVIGGTPAMAVARGLVPTTWIVNAIQVHRQLRLDVGARHAASTTTAPEPRKIDLVAWLDDRHLEAIIGVTQRARQVFGDGVERHVVLRNDPEREPPDFAVIGLTVNAVDRERLIDGEGALSDYLLESYPDVEDDFVIACRRRGV